MRKSIVVFITGVLYATLLNGCGAFVTVRSLNDTVKVKPSNDKVFVDEPSKSQEMKSLANKFALMALFSKVVYRKDLPEQIRNEKGCDYLIKDAKVPDVGMPQQYEVNGTDKKRFGWERWQGNDKAVSCVNKDGLSYETYVYKNKDGKLEEAVIAFRGTENFNLEEALDDWVSNLSAALGMEPPEYRLARELIPGLINGLVAASPNIRIYAAGHSLGGGLAQQAGYLSSRVLEVYAFDTSPVTNWSQLQSMHLIDNDDPVIYRVYHWNEALARVRNISSRFNIRRFNRSDYEFFFQEMPSKVEAHEMGILACHLSKNIQGETADHFYPKSVALELIDKSYGKDNFEHPVCPPSVKLPTL